VLWGWQQVYLAPAKMSTGKIITTRREVQWEWTFLRVIFFGNLLSASDHPQKCPQSKYHGTVGTVCSKVYGTWFQRKIMQLKCTEPGFREKNAAAGNFVTNHKTAFLCSTNHRAWMLSPKPVIVREKVDG
jgi:hypothetical protein